MERETKHFLKLKCKIPEFKDFIERFNIRSNEVEGRFSKLVGRSVEITVSEEHKEKD